MKSFEAWMSDYGESHQNPKNILIHKICVPLIMLTVLGLLWSLPVPEVFKGHHWLNWATIFAVLALLFYLSLNFLMYLGMLIQIGLMCMICDWLELKGILLPFSIVVFIAAWLGQFYGHKVEGKKPSFLKDLTFLLIGPLWVTRFLYQKMGIKV